MKQPMTGGLASILYDDEQKRLEQQRRRETLDRQNNEVMKGTATRYDPIPDMKGAYARVRERGNAEIIQTNTRTLSVEPVEDVSRCVTFFAWCV